MVINRTETVTMEVERFINVTSELLSSYDDVIKEKLINKDDFRNLTEEDIRDIYSHNASIEAGSFLDKPCKQNMTVAELVMDLITDDLYTCPDGYDENDVDYDDAYTFISD